MPRRPEIGNVQLYPNRPLRKADRNGYVLKFYCPLLRTRVRRNCGTRDRTEARRILRECRERLLNGEYAASGGAITAKSALANVPGAHAAPAANQQADNRSWQDCYQRYRDHRSTRIRETSLGDALSRLNIAERIFEGYREDRGLTEGLPVAEVMTLDLLEYLQDRLLAGDECRYDCRSPNTVNSMMGAVMAFVRFCHTRGWIPTVPPVEKLDVDDVMKGRPITTDEFESMLKVTPDVVGPDSAVSWQLALRVIWESGFRVGDLMDFSWDDDRHIRPIWPTQKRLHPTLVIPSSQKNGRTQEIPMLPGLDELLRAIPKQDRTGWIVNPQPIQYEIKSRESWFRPSDQDLKRLIECYSNCSIATACHVSEMSVRKWLSGAEIRRKNEFHRGTSEIPAAELIELRKRGTSHTAFEAQRRNTRLTKERVGRVISLIGEKAGIVVRQDDERTGYRKKFASAHDLRRGCAQRLINAGVSAETLKVIFRHSSFETTQNFYGATRSAQAGAEEVIAKLGQIRKKESFVGGLVGGEEPAAQLSPAEIRKLKALLDSL
ncbi:MAG: integrase family protein [Planctomycetaceae bacterium]|nr:integrase family protein [Planctomycetaceae bacterium]